MRVHKNHHQWWYDHCCNKIDEVKSHKINGFSMYDLKKCEKVNIDQGVFYLGESTKEKSVGYLELNPHTSLILHNRLGGFENLTQVKGSCVMVVFDKTEGTNHKLDEGDKLRIEPIGVWHVHVNPFNKPSLTYWHFDGDIRKIIESIRDGAK